MRMLSEETVKDARNQLKGSHTHTRTHTRRGAQSECGSLGVKQAYDRISLHVVNPILTLRHSETLAVPQQGFTGPYTHIHTHTPLHGVMGYLSLRHAHWHQAMSCQSLGFPSLLPLHPQC